VKQKKKKEFPFKVIFERFDRWKKRRNRQERNPALKKAFVLLYHYP